MVSTALQILGLALSIVGWLGAIVSCALPMWKVTAFNGTNVVAVPAIWEGLWMNCIAEGTEQMHCEFYDRPLDLTQDFQAARPLVTIGLLVALLGICVGIAGASCANCVKDATTRGNLAVVSGFTFAVAGILMLLTGGWSAHSVVQDLHDPLVAQDRKRELGASIYLAFVAGGLLLLGAVLLCCLWPKASDRYPAVWLTASSTVRQSKRSNA